MRYALLVLLLLAGIGTCARAADLPIFDAHLHYSHDAWGELSAKDAIALLRKAGVRRGMVSSSDDEGTQRLYTEAPNLIVPELRPYRKRGEIGTWVRDQTVVTYVEERLKKYRYFAIGEFHLFGADADLPVPRRMVELAKQYKILLHAHSDADAIERLFRQDPEARILWAHAGFERPDRVRELLRKQKNLWADLAFRTDHGSGGEPPPEWREAFLEFPDRFMVGTDTYVAERWHYVPEHAAWSRTWLSTLPPDVAERIAYKNGEAMIQAILARQQ
jgi:hypothetical protein